MQGGNFWEGAAIGLTVGLLNHAGSKLYPAIDRWLNPKPNKYQQYFAQKREEAKNLGKLPTSVIQRIQQLRLAFNVIVNIGAGTEIVSLLLAPFTGGASLPAGYVGLAFNVLGTVGNMAIDIYLFKQTGDPSYSQAAYTRAGFFAATLGVGKMFQLAGKMVDAFVGQFLNVVIDQGLKPEFIKTKY